MLALQLIGVAYWAGTLRAEVKSLSTRLRRIEELLDRMEPLKDWR